MLNQLTISQLAGKLSAREVTARQATQSCLDRIAQVDGKIHAFLSYDAADALAQADAADKALAGGARAPKVSQTARRQKARRRSMIRRRLLSRARLRARLCQHGAVGVAIGLQPPTRANAWGRLDERAGDPFAAREAR